MGENKNRSYHRPIWDDNGRFHYEVIPQKKENNYVAVCLKPPEKVIPVIFIPGVMGSNLKNEDGEVWQFSGSSMIKWPFSNAETRKLAAQGPPGDATVPVTAIRISSPHIRGVLATDVDHEGAYSIDPVDRSRSVFRDTSDALVFTVRSVVKIAQQVPPP